MIIYIFKAAFILSACLVFYKVLLQKETFFQLNRLVLLSCLVLSFCLPFVPVPQQFSFKSAPALPILSGFVTPEFISEKPVAERFKHAPAIPAAPTVKSTLPRPTFDFTRITTFVTWLYWFGVAAFGINFLLQITVLLYRAYTLPFIRDGRFRIVEVTGDKAPCSFGNHIFINPEKYDWETYNQILLHEKIHVRQGHSLDILLGEIGLVLQWFNPFAWQYRQELEKNLEYLTDNQVLQEAEVEKTSYQMSLLKVSAPHFPLSLTTNYNQSLLKKRLVMMNAKKSNLHTSWKYFFLAPLLILFVYFFNEPMVMGQKVTGKTSGLGFNQSAAGTWEATVQGDKLFVKFINKGGERETIFGLSEFNNFSRGNNISVSTKREAGTLTLTGKFEGAQGSGRYSFSGDRSFTALLQQEGILVKNGSEQMNFFLLDINQAYIKMLKAHGYTQLKKQDLTSLASLGVGKEKNKDPNLEPVPEPGSLDKNPLSNMINFKAVGITEQYIKTFEEAGFNNISPGTIINFKSVGVTPQYIKSFTAMGYKDIPYGTIVNFKSVGVTPEFIKSFWDAGYKNVSYGTIVNLKAIGVTPPIKK